MRWHCLAAVAIATFAGLSNAPTGAAEFPYSAAINSDDVYVRQAAGAVLEELAGNSYGYDPRLAPEENREAASKFRRWGAEKYGKDWEKYTAKVKSRIIPGIY